MPRTDILTELKSAISTNDTLTKATTDFLSNMQDLKDFHKKTEGLEDTTFIHYSKTMFSKWTLRELFIFLALFGTDERLINEKLELEKWQIEKTYKAIEEADKGNFASDGEVAEFFKKWAS